MTSAKKRLAAQVTVVAIAAAFILVGIFRNEVQTVLTKAINICFECMGLG